MLLNHYGNIRGSHKQRSVPIGTTNAGYLMKIKFFCSLSLLGLLSSLPQLSRAAVGFTVTPSAVSNTYGGTISLQVTGLNTGDSVVVQKYLDINSNGVLDANDLFVQQFQLKDGQGPPVIGTITNFSVPGDLNSTNGSITTQLYLMSQSPEQLIVGQYFYKLSNPVGNVPLATNLFTVTNFPFAHGFSGSVVSNGTATTVPFAQVFLLATGKGFHPLAQTVANASGNYSVLAPPGTYKLMAIRGTNFTTDMNNAPVVTLSSVNIATNINLLPATQNISGQFVDATNSSVGLPGVLMAAQNTNRSVWGFAVTDSNGNFAVPVNSTAQWTIGVEQLGFTVLGYVGSNNNTNANGGATGLIVAYQKANALIYGSVLDAGSNALPGIRIQGQNGNNGSGPYQSTATVDPNGNYVMGVVATNWGPSIDLGNSPLQYGNYVFSGGPSWTYNNGGSGTNIVAGATVQANFTALLATNQLTGNVKYNGTNLIGVGVNANTTTNGIYFDSQVDTDTNGNYSLNVGTGIWSVNLNCNGGSDSLQSIVGGGAQCPPGTSLNITNGINVVNFNLQSYTNFLNGKVVDDIGNPVANMNVFATTNSSSQGTFQATTDSGGNFQMGIVGGNYLIFLNNDANSGFPSRGLVGPTVPVSIPSVGSVSNFIVIAPRVKGAIKVQVNNGSSVGVSGVSVYANLTAGVTNYSPTSNQSYTDNSGAVTLPACNGNWAIGLDSSSVQNLGYNPPSSQNTIISNNTNTVTFTLTSQGGSPLQISTVSLTNATQNALYYLALAASGGQPTYKWSLGPGSASLPGGLFLATNGIISGTPGGSGTSSFIVQVTDAASTTVTKVFSLTVNASTIPAVVLLGAPVRPGNGLFQFNFPSASGVLYTVQYSTNLKAWTSLVEFSGSGGTQTIIDPNAAGSSARYYRVKVGQ